MEEVKNYTLRKLQAPDVFVVTTIISKVGIKEFKECFKGDEIKSLIANSKAEEESKELNITAVGIDVIFNVVGVILENLENCQKDVYKLLSRLSGIPVKDFETMDASIFIEMICDVLKDNKKDFMKVASRFFK